MKFTAGMSLAGFLAVFAGVFSFGNGNRCDKKTNIELYDPSDRSKFECWPAPDCHDGQGPSVEPGSTHPKGTDVHCRPCHNGFFSNRETNYMCRKCTTCGNKLVRLTCTRFRDRLCDNLCISRKFYFNYTDHQCYPCTECCGANSTNIESQCLSSINIGSVIGKKGALHCKVLSAQQCGEMPKNSFSSVTPGINNTGAVEKNCSESKNNVTPDSSNPVSEDISKEKSSEWTLDSLHIVLICLLTFATFICVVLCLLLKKAIDRQSPSSGSCLCFGSFYSRCEGQGCRGDCERLIKPFRENLKFIPEGVRINSIPYDIENLIKKLDAKQPLSKNWYDVGRKLGVAWDDLNLIKREDDRQGGSPTSLLLNKLTAEFQPVPSLRKFVQVLHDLKRNDIVNPIIEFYKQPATTNETNV